MRWDWIPLSAAALVIGAMSLAFGAMLNPVSPGGGAAEAVATVTQSGGRWLGVAVMYFFASVTLILGLPAVLSLFLVRARRLGALAVAVFAVGAIGTSGYAMLLVFFRALVQEDAIRTGSLEEVTNDVGLGVFLYGWIVGFYAGILLLAVALLVARRTPVWVPVLLVVFVAMLPLVGRLGRTGQVIQVVAMAIAFTGIAIAAVNPAGFAEGRAGARSGSAPVA